MPSSTFYTIDELVQLSFLFPYNTNYQCKVLHRSICMLATSCPARYAFVHLKIWIFRCLKVSMLNGSVLFLMFIPLFFSWNSWERVNLASLVHTTDLIHNSDVLIRNQKQWHEQFTGSFSKQFKEIGWLLWKRQRNGGFPVRARDSPNSSQSQTRDLQC